MKKVGVVRSYQLNESDMMTYRDASDDMMQFDAIGTHEVKLGSLGSFVHEHSEAGYQSILDQDYDVLDVPDPMYPWACWLVERHPKVVVTVWENLPWRMIGENWRRALEKATLIVVRSHMAQTAVMEMGLPKDKVQYVPAGVDMEMFKPEERLGYSTVGFPRRIVENTPIVIFPGRMVWEKGVYDLFFASLHQQWITYFIGDGPAKEPLETLCKLKGDVNVLFLGSVPHSKMEQWYFVADVVVYPSLPTPQWQEQFGISVIEAAASGCKIVLTHQSVFEEFANIIPNVFLCAPGDFVGLREAINKALKAPYQPLGYFKYDSKLVGERIRELYGSL